MVRGRNGEEMGIGMARIWVEKVLKLTFGKIILVTLPLSLIFSYI